MIHQSVPLWLKIAYTLFLAVLIAIYWPAYGPVNFLWFCDVAAILTGFALWLESPLLSGSQAVAVTISQTIWIADFVSGGRLLGVSAYMFDHNIPLYVRGLSTFHIWLPFLLLWLVWRLGYDHRSFWLQTFICILVFLASFLLTDPRHPPTRYPYAAINVNRVYGPKIRDVQQVMPPLLYLLLQMVLYPLVLYLPAHLLFRRIFSQSRGAVSSPDVA